MAVPLYPTDDPDVFGGFLAVPPDWAPGTYSVSVTAVNAAGDVTPLAAPLEVVPAAFPAETITLAGDALQLLDPVLRQNELQRLDEVWKRSTPGLDWQAHWAYPRKAVATSGYGVVRTYEPGDTPGRHLGLDLRGDSGDPVAAAAPGTVALAERLTVRGSTVLVDHGWGVFTAYYHLSSIDVTPGQRVAAGAILGRVGATGMVTGPHLHWEVRVAGVAVDPVPWVSLGPPGS
jgi:murein DD-endopeptidase MepM/ murein hydrolase activator NlpD